MVVKISTEAVGPTGGLLASCLRFGVIACVSALSHFNEGKEQSRNVSRFGDSPMALTLDYLATVVA